MKYAEEWLAFQVATTYGLDKAPINERLEWTRANHHLIASVAEDPIDTFLNGKQLMRNGNS